MNQIGEFKEIEKELEKELDAVESQANREVRFVIGGVLIVWAFITLTAVILG